MLKEPPTISAQPFSASSSLPQWIPSVPAVRPQVPPTAQNASLAWIACSAASTVTSPETSTSSSLQTIPCPVAELTASEPPPFTVRSALQNTAPSMLASSSAAYSPVVASVFRLPSASVTHTFFAARTRIAAESELVTLAPLSTIWTFSPSAFTTTWPSERDPEIT